MNLLPLIEAKRDGATLSQEELARIVRAVVTGEIPDYQVAAWLMAVYFRGLDASETRALTLAMRDSGERLEFPADSRPLVDKHSTGGVGDKVSLPLVPLLISLGFRVPMIAGRGLGITGGTLDKLDSIPGFRTRLELCEIRDAVQRLGGCICGQTDRMVPADRILYALRDVTGTVPSIPLITASILSKKLAESIQALVLDVTFGRAAFMQDLASARALARSLADLARDCGVATRVLITRMDAPVGRAVGNWLEVMETEAFLRGDGAPDLKELVIAFASELLLLTGHETSQESAMERCRRELASGRPHATWRALLSAQGARLAEYEALLQCESRAERLVEVRSDRGGWVHRCDAQVLGGLLRELGAGRLRRDDVIRLEVGADRIRKPGDRVEAGEVLLRLHLAAGQDVGPATSAARSAFEIGDAPPTVPPVVVERA